MLFTLLDLLGVFAFALSGGVRGVECRLDPFGVVFLAFVAATTGGILRDLLIGATPPYAIAHWQYLAVSTVAGLSCYFAYDWMGRLRRPVALFDAVGLGLSAAVGAQKAMAFGLTPLMAALLGMLSAIGGGMARDILTTRTPMVLHKEIYALAAFAGAAMVAFADNVGVPQDFSVLLGAAVAISVRLVAIVEDWRLPPARLGDDDVSRRTP